MKIQDYDCTRSFLYDYIYSHYGSLDEFLTIIDAHCSKSSLSHFFKKDKSGQFIKSYSFKLDTWADILVCLKELNDPDIGHLFILKIKEDFSVKYSHQAKQRKVIERLGKFKFSENISDFNDMSKLAPEAISIAKIYDLLPESFRRRMRQEVEKVSNYYLGGKAKSKTSALVKHLKAISK